MPQNKIIDYQIIKRKIKYPRLEFKTGKLVVIIPIDGDFDTPQFIDKYKDWIRDKELLINKYSRKKASLRKPELDKSELRIKIVGLVDQYIKLIGLKPKRIMIKKMRSKWGSCSVAKNLCFNSLLGKLPNKMISYIVYHEMCHLRQRKHNGNFKALLKKQFENPEKIERKLFNYWFSIIKD